MNTRPMWIMALLTAVALTGCGKATSPVAATQDNGGGTVGSDQAQVSAVLQNNPEYVDDSVWANDQMQSLDAANGFAAISPLRWRRVITHVERNVSTEFGAPDSAGHPTLALVTVNKHITGRLDIMAASGEPAETTLVHKPVDDQSTRKLVLKRVAVRDSIHWRLVGTSGVEVHTNGGSTHIASLRIQSAGVDTTITDPLELHRLRRIMIFQPGAPVTLTATTGRNDDVVLFYGHDMRRRFVNNGNGTYTFEFPSGRFPGLRHLGVDALSNGTLFDDTAAYDSNAWLLAFAVDAALGTIERR